MSYKNKLMKYVAASLLLAVSATGFAEEVMNNCATTSCPVACKDARDMFVRFSGTVGHLRKSHYKNDAANNVVPGNKHNIGFGGSFAVGGAITDCIDLELEYNVSQYRFKKAGNTASQKSYRNYQSISVNAIYNFVMDECFTLQAGVGAGAAYSTIKTAETINKNGTFSYSKWVPTANVSVGVMWDLNERIAALFTYRVRGYGKSKYNVNNQIWKEKRFPISNNIEFGVRVKF